MGCFLSLSGLVGVLLRFKVRFERRDQFVEFVYGGVLYPLHRYAPFGGRH